MHDSAERQGVVMTRIDVLLTRIDRLFINGLDVSSTAHPLAARTYSRNRPDKSPRQPGRWRISNPVRTRDSRFSSMPIRRRVKSSYQHTPPKNAEISLAHPKSIIAKTLTMQPTIMNGRRRPNLDLERSAKMPAQQINQILSHSSVPQGCGSRRAYRQEAA